MTDHIDTLTAGHEQRLRKALDAALTAIIEAVSVDALASALDDDDPDHIRDQLAVILPLGDDGTPEALTSSLASISEELASVFVAIAALAASQASHTINPNTLALTQGKASAASAIIGGFIVDTSTAITDAITSAITSTGTPYARARQLKRSIGITTKQAATLEAMRVALDRYLDTPRTLIPAHRDPETGVRIPAAYVRNADARAILAATRGRITAAQRQSLTKALNDPKLTLNDANAILDASARAMRRFRVRATAGEGIHKLAERAKLTGWQIAQRLGAISIDRLRYWQTAGDERVRHIHSETAAMNVHGVGLDQPFITPLGPTMTPPLEYGCRCKATLGRAA